MTKWLEPLSGAWEGIRTHKLRSALTMLGIVIGIAAVISLMSIGTGAQAEILSYIEGMGADLITISPRVDIFGGTRAASAQPLTQEDAMAIREQVAYIDMLGPIYSTSLPLVFGGKNMNAQVIGVTPEYQDIQDLKISSGAHLSDYDYQRGAKVAVLGSEIKETLFEDADPIGQQIRMGNNIVRVIGVLESKEALMGSPNNAVLIPLTAMQQIVAQPRTSQGELIISSIVLTVSDEKQVDYVVAEITSLLRDRHRLGPDESNDFRITSIQQISEAVAEVSDVMTLLITAIAGISLLVGGIGVMNIMLVSVLERTREIGIRKALGARDRDIWSQFLVEAALLTFAGGIVGVIVGWVVSQLFSRIAEMPTIITADTVILAVSVAVGIGLFFGFYPAWNASRLDPIEALRSE